MFATDPDMHARVVGCEITAQQLRRGGLPPNDPDVHTRAIVERARVRPLRTGCTWPTGGTWHLASAAPRTWPTGCAWHLAPAAPRTSCTSHQLHLADRLQPAAPGRQPAVVSTCSERSLTAVEAPSWPLP